MLQAFIPGKLGSLSLLCCDSVAQLLGYNEQRIAVRHNEFHLLGTTVNGLRDHAGQFERGWRRQLPPPSPAYGAMSASILSSPSTAWWCWK